MQPKKIGILGGTFDPPHIGHLIIAKEAFVQCHLHKVLFMPSAQPPHKEANGISNAKGRVEMVRRMIADKNEFELSLVEFERQGPSYTIDTIKELKQRNPNTDFYFIIGGDMVETLDSWEGIKDLLKLVTFIGVRRPGFHFSSRYFDQILAIDVPEVDISSTFLRDRFVNKENTEYYVTKEVRKYIEENQLYE